MAIPLTTPVTCLPTPVDGTVDVSVVIVTWNACRLVAECLESIERGGGDDGRLEIIVVDNASTDGTPELIHHEHPGVRLIRNGDNRGFAAGNNVGLRQAKGRYVCLVNSDVNVPAGCLQRMVAFMDAHPDVGLLGPAMLGQDGRVHRSTMRVPTVWSTFCNAIVLDTLMARLGLWGGYLMKDFAHDRTRDVEVLNGWFWLARREAIEAVGLLDERFFIYAEDIDWCYRFAKAGWRLVFTSDVGALHYGGASSSRQPIRFHIEMQRANLQFWLKHRGRASAAAYAATLMLHHAIRVVGFSVVYAARPRRRDEATFKIRRGLASLAWLARSAGRRVAAAQ